MVPQRYHFHVNRTTPFEILKQCLPGTKTCKMVSESPFFHQMVPKRYHQGGCRCPLSVKWDWPEKLSVKWDRSKKLSVKWDSFIKC